MGRKILGSVLALVCVSLTAVMAESDEPGTEKWASPTKGAVLYSSPALAADGSIYVGTHEGKLHAVNPYGTEKWVCQKWVFPEGDNELGVIQSSPAVGVDGTIYVGEGTDNGCLYAINPDGSQKWAFKDQDSSYHIFSSPALDADGSIYVSATNGNLYAVTPGDGKMKWKFYTGNGLNYASPVIGPDGIIYIGSENRKFYALTPDGNLKWAFPKDDRPVGLIASSPALAANGTIYVSADGGGLDKGRLYALYPDGQQKWVEFFDNATNSSPAVGPDGTIYVGSGEGNLYAFNPDNGNKKIILTTSQPIASSPAIGADGTIYVGSFDMYLYAILPNGEMKWRFNKTEGKDYSLGQVYSSPAIGADGTIYLGSSGGRLFAIYSDSPGLAKSSWPMFRHDPRHTGRLESLRRLINLPAINMLLEK